MQLESRYSALRAVASLMKFMAIIQGAGGTLLGSLALGLGITGIGGSSGNSSSALAGLGASAGLVGVVYGIFTIIVALLSALFLYAFASLINVFIDTEANTRETTLRMRMMSQAPPPPRSY